MITDNLASLFAPAPRGAAMDAQFRVGQLLSFSADDGSNVVAIGQAELPNLPMLQTGAEIGMEAGDNVLIMYLGNSAVILGKIATVGGPNYGASNSGHAGLLLNASNFGATVAGTTVITDSSTIAAPGWANSVAVTMLGAASLHNGSGALDNLTSRVRLSRANFSDAFSAAAPAAVTSTFVGSTFALYANVVPVTPATPLTFTYTVITGGGTWPADAAAIATLSVAVQFFREGT